MKKTKALKRILSTALCLMLALSCWCMTFTAENVDAVQAGDFMIAATDGATALTDKTDYEFSSKRLTVKTTVPVTIGMGTGVTSTDNKITIDTTAGNATVTLDNITVSGSATWLFRVTGGNICTFVLKGESSIYNSYKYDDTISVSSASVIFTSTTGGILNVTSDAQNCINATDGSITLSGNAVVNAKSAGTRKAALCVEDDDGNITVCENAVLNTADTARGISHEGNKDYGVIIKESAKINVTGMTSYGIYSKNGYIKIDGEATEINVTGTEKPTGGIFAETEVDIKGKAKITLTDTGSFGIRSYKGSFAVSDDAEIDVKNATNIGIDANTSISISGNAKIKIDAEASIGIDASSNGISVTGNADITVKNTATGLNIGATETDKAVISDKAVLKFENCEKGIIFKGVEGVAFDITGTPSIKIENAEGTAIGFGNSTAKVDVADNAIVIVMNSTRNSAIGMSSRGTVTIGGSTKIDISGQHYESINGNFTFTDNTVLSAKGATKRGIDGNITLAKNAKATIDAAAEKSVDGNVTAGGNSVFTSKGSEYGIYGMLTASDNAEINVICTEKYALKTNSEVTPTDGRVYEVMSGSAADSAAAAYYTEKSTVKVTSGWKYFSAKVTDMVDVTLSGKDKGITYGDSETYDLSQLFDIDPNAGKATYTVTGGTQTSEVNDGVLSVTEAGTFNVKLTTAVNGKYKSSEANATLTVNKAVPTVAAPTAIENIVYTGEEQSLVISGTTTGGELLYSLDGENYTSQLPKAIDSKTYTIYYKVDGGNNYEDIAPDTVEVKIEKATPTGLPIYTVITGDGKTLKDAGITVDGGTFSVTGTVAWEQSENTVAERDAVYSWIFTPDDTQNYTTISGDVMLWDYTGTRTENNVIPEDKELLEKAKDSVENALKENLSDEEKKAFDTELERINNALEVLANTEKVEKIINSLPDNITKSDADYVSKAEKAYNALSDYEKSLVSAEAKAKLDKAVLTISELNKENYDKSPVTEDAVNIILIVSVLAVMALSVLVKRKIK